MPWTNEAAESRPIWRLLDPIDNAVGAAWEPLRNIRWLNRLMVIATNVGEHGLVWIAVAIGQYVRRVVRGDTAEANARLRRAMVALTVESIAVNGGLKSLTRRTRPAGGTNRADGVRMPISSSMPSGHATSAVMSAVVLGDDADGAGEKAALAVAAGFVAASRFHVRIHHFTDVAAGALLGYAIGRVVIGQFPIAPTATADKPAGLGE